MQKIKDLFPGTKYPHLYSKRGFEKNRIKIVIPKDRTQLAVTMHKNGDQVFIDCI